MNDVLSALHFTRPQMLWCLLALPLLAWWWWRRGHHANVWRDIVDPHLLPHLLAGAGSRRRWPMLIAAFACVLAILALAGPSWRKGEQALWNQRAPLVVALDLSSATNAADVPPSRLLQARAKLATLLRERQGGQVGLIAFAGEAFTVAPLTEDASNVALFLDSLSPEVMPVDGQRGDNAIEQSVRLLKQGGFERGDIVLLTDHSDRDAQTAAAQALAQGFRVSALGIGSAGGAAYRKNDGSIARARLDAGSLRDLAARGGGRYAALSRDDADLRDLGVLDPQRDDSSEKGPGQRTVWLDEGYWLLPPLMLLALLAFRRGASAWVLVTCALLWTMPSHAAERNWWKRADQQQYEQAEKGVQAYRQGDYATAEQMFAGQQNADALYNHGNALAKQGRYDEAIAAYDAALAKQPGMADAVANRTAVERARQQSSSQGQQQGQGQNRNGPSSQQNQNNGGQPSPNPSSPNSGNSAQPPPPQRSEQPQKPDSSRGNSSSSSNASTPPPQSPADARAQQSADAAQRERMQQALARQRAQSGDQKATAPMIAANETPEQRERRQALEAWLKRVPDDPGGLLKTKFQLEYERRMREGR